LVVLAAVALLAAACSDDTTSESTVGELLPFEQVQDSEFTFEADPVDPGRGIFRVTTTEPMICTIVWGETEEFGNFNNSLAMNGTGIVQHDVFLPGAEPGVEYFFRVQGSTADGRQFRSETDTFVIEGDGAAEPADTAEVAAADGPNLAEGATVVDVSSEFSDAFAADKAIDGDPSTDWSTDGDGDEGFITIDLGSPQEIAAVEFITRSMADGSAITEEFTVTVDDGEMVGPFPAGSPSDPRSATVDLDGQVLRFDVDASTGGNVGAIEIRVLGPPAGG
jgi:hypothetical protein